MAPVKFTPELFGELPRRSAATPNADGTYALYTVSTYSFDAASETKETKIINLKTNEHSLFSDDPDVTSAQWFKGNQVLWTKTKDGKSDLFVGTVGSADKGKYLLGSIDAPISEVKTKVLADGTIAFLFSAPMDVDGKLLNPESLKKPKTTAREYETVLVRFWDAWSKPYRSALFYTTLHKQPNKETYKLREATPVNLLLGTRLRYPFLDDPFGRAGFYDVSNKGVVFTTADPALNFAEIQSKEAYWIPIESPESPNLPKPTQIPVSGFTGSTSDVVFSPDESKLAFLKVDKHIRDWWGPVTLFIASTDKPDKLTKVNLVSEKGEDWDRWPSSLLWSADNKTIFFTADDTGRSRIFSIGVGDASSGVDSIKATPRKLTTDGTVSSMFRYSDSPAEHRILYSATSLIDSSIYATVDSEKGDIKVLSSLTENGSLIGTDKSHVTDFWCPSKDGKYEIHVWQLNPPNFDPKKKYPLAFFIHGGPQVAWLDQWSTRWCPALYAAQGYVVLVPNFTGSSSYGLNFAGDIVADWGGRPYDDIVQTFEYAKQNIPHADTSRAVAMGGSFGGYMVNWIQGQPLAKQLKALVCHNGIYSMPTSILACDSAQEHKSDMGAAYWEDMALWDKNDPSRFSGNWSTPMLVIHSDNDFRCPIDQGVAPFMVCQLRGIPSRLLNFPDENHFVLARENQLHWYKSIIGWINKWTGVEGGIELAPPISEPEPTHVKD